MTIGASIDVGSNSVHLLVARVTDHRIEPLADTSVFLGLGAAVVERHHLGVAARSELIDALAADVETSRALGATEVTIIGTEPIRRAADGPSLAVELERRVGVPIHALTHEEEAFLTVVGVTQGRPVRRETIVVDVGGGSSEFCFVGPTGPPRAIGLRLGSDRLTRRFAQDDPPSPEALYEMLNEARAVIDTLPPVHPSAIIAVGGTVSNLMKVVRFGATEGVLTRDETARALHILTAEPAELAAKRHGVKPIRARILPAGAVIVDAILRRFGADSLRVADAGIREGAIIAVAHAGRAWRDRLPELAHGWRR